MPVFHTSGGVFSSNRDWFRYRPQTDTWSRVLLRGGIQQGFIKEIIIPLTPTNGWSDIEGVANVKRCMIIVSEPSVDKGNYYTHLLPKSQYELMTIHYGKKLRNFLLDCNILGRIDIERLSLNDSKGVAFKDLSKRYPYKELLFERLRRYPDFFQTPPSLKRHDELVKSKRKS